MSDVIWQFEQVNKTGRNGYYRLQDVNLEIKPGITAVSGPSGAGKSSLLNIMVGFEQPDAGEIVANLHNDGRALNVYWVPQDAGLWPNLTVKEHLLLVNSRISDSDIAALLYEFGIQDKTHELPGHLSKGEGARLAIARALVADPAVLVMDEPLAHIDISRKNEIWQFLMTYIRNEKISLVFSSHDPQNVVADADQVICVKHGMVVYAGSVENLYYRPDSPFMAGFLGEYNWFEPNETWPWLGRKETRALCLRPEQLQVMKSAKSLIVVQSVRFAGTGSEVVLLHITERKKRSVFVRHSTQSLAPKQHVTLKVLND